MHLIAGVDPGTTQGIALLGLNGRLVKVMSSKDMGIGNTIDFIISYGTPTIIATDVNPAPDFASKLASKLGALVYSPRPSLFVEEKIRMTRDFATGDAHQRDALAAALVAYNSFREKFEKISSMGYGDRVKHLVAQGTSIADAVKSLEKPVRKPPKKGKPVKPSKTVSEKRIVDLKHKNSKLTARISELEDELDNLKHEYGKAKSRHTGELEKQPEIQKRDQVIESLQTKIEILTHKMTDTESLRMLWQLQAEGEVIPVSVFPKSSNGVTLLKRQLKSRDIKYLEGIEVAFTKNNNSKTILGEHGIQVLDAGFVQQTAGVYYVTRTDYERASRDVKVSQSSLEKIVTEYRENHS